MESIKEINPSSAETEEGKKPAGGAKKPVRGSLEDKQKSARVRKIVYQVVMYLVLTVLAVILCFPFFVMVSRSFMDMTDIYAARIFPTHVTFDNYITIFAERNYFRYALNTMIVVVFNVIAVPLSAALCAFGFSRQRWKGQGIVFGCVLSTLMIPGTVLQIPLYVFFYNLGWLGTLLPLTIPAAFGGGAINIFLIRQFMRGIPKTLDEAAIIDGAGLMRRFFFIILPLCKPILIFVAVGAFSSAWSDFFSPLIYLTGYEEKYTLAVKIYEDSILNSQLDTSNLKMAAGVFMSLLPLVVFALYQRKLIDGVMIGAVKG